jgi:hypothetical protein
MKLLFLVKVSLRIHVFWIWNLDFKIPFHEFSQQMLHLTPIISSYTHCGLNVIVPQALALSFR